MSVKGWVRGEAASGRKRVRPTFPVPSAGMIRIRFEGCVLSPVGTPLETPVGVTSQRTARIMEPGRRGVKPVVLRRDVVYIRYMERHPHTWMIGLVAILVSGSLAMAAERFVPVVAQVQGANGSYWNTEVWLTNVGESPASYSMTFLPAGQNNADLLLRGNDSHTIAPRETVDIKAIVPPGKTGALKIVAGDSVLIRCRVFNMHAHGSVGQLVPALTRDQMISPGSRGILTPLVRNGQFRTNAGFFNPSENPVHIHVEIWSNAGKLAGAASYTLDPGSQVQINDFLLQFKMSRADGFHAVVTADGPCAAYATLVDRRSGAATFVSAAVR